jgi:hypothetical protein
VSRRPADAGSEKRQIGEDEQEDEAAVEASRPYGDQQARESERHSD